MLYDFDYSPFLDNANKTPLPQPAAYNPPRVVDIKRTHSGSHLQYKLDWHERPSTKREALGYWVETVIGKHYARAERAYLKGV